MARLLCGTSPVKSPLEGRQSLGTRDRNSAITPRSRQASALERRLEGRIQKRRSVRHQSAAQPAYDRSFDAGSRPCECPRTV